MQLTSVDEAGVTVVEGTAGVPLMTGAHDAREDARGVLEACFSAGVRAVLLYAENLPPNFFDLSSGQAGTILQKFRNYGVRLAVVSPPGQITPSSRFGEMVREEHQGRHFQIFESREAARAWLATP